MNEGVAVAVVVSQKKNVNDIFVEGVGMRANSDWCEWLWNTVSLLQVIARKEEKEGRGRKEGERQDGKILNQKKRSSRVKGWNRQSVASFWTNGNKKEKKNWGSAPGTKKK